ncbi:DyP-type peroxidase [Stereum hirsutum FP-91666 SS1]|uniref:DyP-type peroxidase n=1 Tax=Stereum hirsutum (strain FP-91666) TaxID=721885 RepID=UPI0004410449|nr:DyP-type peroxidase [Stereum hirsutum FP-91666 SS1]EIM91696.1 DyP-type peroxidase [Stereum hirsutum FP-91666 SS1]
MSSTTIPRASLDLTDIQGDILSGLPKKTQTYVFFQITDANDFRIALSDLVPVITSTEQVLKHRKSIADNKKKAAEHGHAPPLLDDIVGVNIAFSHTGLVTMGITDDIGDKAFTDGQLSDAENLGDKGSTDAHGNFVPSDWLNAFRHPVHGVILLSGPSHASVKAMLRDVEQIFRVGSHHSSIKIVLEVVGDVRPGKEKGHEHFGFLDGISQPAVEGFDTKPNPGQETIPQGVMLLGRDVDKANKRPEWAVDGSFLALRYLSQLVPEFDKFLDENPIDLPGLPREKGSELLGARMVGRWKSGAPIDITPLMDDPALGSDPLRNNNFRYQGELNSQTRCPFAAHTRKTNPRASLEDFGQGGNSIAKNRIIRRGVQFGPEVTEREREEGKTINDRGLIFACYQSNIENGFQFLQSSWANQPKFPPGTTVTPGLDPIIGQTTDAGARQMSGANPKSPENNITFPIEFVVSKGGEYFFSPSISAIRDSFALGVQIQGQ